MSLDALESKRIKPIFTNGVNNFKIRRAFILSGALQELFVGCLCLLEVLLEVEGDKDNALALVELGLELDPVETRNKIE